MLGILLQFKVYSFIQGYWSLRVSGVVLSIRVLLRPWPSAGPRLLFTVLKRQNHLHRAHTTTTSRSSSTAGRHRGSSSGGSGSSSSSSSSSSSGGRRRSRSRSTRGGGGGGGGVGGGGGGGSSARPVGFEGVFRAQSLGRLASFQD